MNLLFAGVILVCICVTLHTAFNTLTETVSTPVQATVFLTYVSVLCIALANLLAVVLK